MRLAMIIYPIISSIVDTLQKASKTIPQNCGDTYHWINFHGETYIILSDIVISDGHSHLLQVFMHFFTVPALLHFPFFFCFLHHLVGLSFSQGTSQSYLISNPCPASPFAWKNTVPSDPNSNMPGIGP